MASLPCRVGPWHRLTDLKSSELQVMLRTVCQEAEQIHQFTMYFIPEKSNAFMAEKEQNPPPKSNQALTPTKPLLTDRDHGVWGGRLCPC